jgi:hypothetical protein
LKNDPSCACKSDPPRRLLFQDERGIFGGGGGRAA